MLETADPLACVLAHQDDEVMVSAHITRRVRAGAPVYLAYTTGGGFGGSELREREALVAAGIMGIERSNVVFLRHRDARSYMEAPALFDEVAQLLARWRPADIMTCAYEGGHIDHDVANMVTAAAALRACPWAGLHEFPCYNAYRRRYGMVCGRFIPGPAPTYYLPLTQEDKDLKARLWREAYRSQRLAVGLMWLVYEDRKEARRGEPSRRLPRYDYLVPPHGGELGYERYGVALFGDFRRAALSVPGPWTVGALRPLAVCGTYAERHPSCYGVQRGEMEII